MKLKEAIQKMKMNNSPDGLLLRMVAESALSEMKDKMDKLLEEYKQELHSILREIQSTAKQDILQMAEIHINQKIPQLKGVDGKTPTKAELIAIIKPLIPQIKDGATPTKKELLSIIKPLIPEQVDRNYIIKEILAQLKLPKAPTAEVIAEVVVEKLNKTEESIKISAIKGLEIYLKKLGQSIQQNKSGGGMGNWVHQSFNVNSSTTTITLSNNIAANGFAIMAFYQGQFIVRGTHYTQSGKVLTLTFTPDNSTIIDTAYVRT